LKIVQLHESEYHSADDHKEEYIVC